MQDGASGANSVKLFPDDIEDLKQALLNENGEDLIYIPYCLPRFVTFTSNRVTELMRDVFPESNGL